MATKMYAGMEIEVLDLSQDEEYQELVRISQGFGRAFQIMGQQKIEDDRR